MKQTVKFYAYFLATLLLPLVSQATTGTVLDAYKYAWSDHSGYVNLENVVVDDTALSGFAWSANHGWIKFNPSTGGVFNDGQGNLSGYAWGEQLGWINFDGVSIDDSGRFVGEATGDLVGTLTFDCSYCDVRTDWQAPQVEGATMSRSSSGTRQENNWDTVIPPIESPANTAEVAVTTRDIPVGDVVVTVSDESYFDSIIFDVASVDAVLPESFDGTTFSFVGGFFDITAHDTEGNQITSFTHPIKITLPLPNGIYGTQELGVYWFNEINNKWVLIPDAIFSERSVSFMVNHLTRFAIISLGKGSAVGSLTPTIDATNQAQASYGYGFLVLVVLIIIVVTAYRKRRP